KAYDLTTKRVLYDVETKDADWNCATELIANPDGKTLFVRTPLGSISAVDVAWPWEPEAIEASTRRIYALAFSPGGSFLASAGQELGVFLWDADSGKPVKKLPCSSEIFSLAFSPDGKMLAAGSIDGPIFRWEVATWKVLSPLLGHKDRVPGLAFTDN